MKNQLIKHLAPYDQTHLVQFWKELTADEQSALASQIESIDFSQLQRLCSDPAKQIDWADLANRSTSPPAIRLEGQTNAFAAAEAIEAGEAALRSSQVAIIVVAGGQGSRLGFPHPKGMFPLGPVSERTLFQIHADRIVAANQQYGVDIPWYVMTSPATDAETRDYFQSLPVGDLPTWHVFCQGTMPAVDCRSGKVLLAEKGKLFESPDGHGGTLAALNQSGCLDDMTDRGIRYLVYFQVDNPLVDVCNPEFIGYHILAQSEMTSQVVAKVDPAEKVGAVVAVDGGLRIIEYSDLPRAAAQRRNRDGSLTIWAGSIAVHVFDVDFLQRSKQHAENLPFHEAHKVVPYVDERGVLIEPDQPNAIKFERFIFDLLPHARNALVVEVAESEAFAPLKNASTEAKDTAETARAAMMAQHRRWLRAAGAIVADNVQIEINPRFSASPAALRARIKPGMSIHTPHYFI